MIQVPVPIDDVTIQRAADGDQSAWETIVRTYRRKVFNVAYRFVGTYDEASAYAWATLLTKLARPHRLYRDGASARWVVRRLGAFWMAC